MKLVESLVILLIIVAVLAHEIRPQAGEWTSNVRFGDVQLELALDLGSWPMICFHGMLRQSTKTITSVDFCHRHTIAPRMETNR
jgi:hypothetical protein